MKAIEICKYNLGEWGYVVGKGVNGKGTEIFHNAKYAGSSWGDISSDNNIERMKKIVDEYGAENLFATEINVIGEDRIHRYRFDASRHEESAERFSVQEMYDMNFKGIEYLSLSLKPKLVGYIPLHKYRSTLDDQKDLYIATLELEGRKIYDGFFDSEYDEPDDIMKFRHVRDDIYMDDEYELQHGGNVCEGTGNAMYFDGRISNYNYMVVDDFWAFGFDDSFSYADPKEKYCVYDRKGKDWYVGLAIEECEICITYRNDDGDLVEDELFYTYESYSDNDSDEEGSNAAARLMSVLQGMKDDVEVKGYIYNNLGIGHYDGYRYLSYNESAFNLPLIERELDDLYEVGMCITDWVEWGGTNYEEMCDDAYERWLRSNMEDDKLFGKYTHLRKLKQLLEKEGKELVMTKPYGELSMELYAIKYGKEEYHFRLKELFDTNPKAFYEKASSSLTKRILERKDRADLLNKAKMVFVSIEDSLKSGNCMSGTKSFCYSHGIDIDKVGGIRGDVLLSMDYNNFTRRAVLQAIARSIRPEEAA